MSGYDMLMCIIQSKMLLAGASIDFVHIKYVQRVDRCPCSDDSV